MRLHLLTWQEVEAYLAEQTGIIIPIGSTEQHGPNGMIGTDALCAEAVALKVGEKADALVGPTLSIGMAQHHLGFAGSVTLRPTTLIAVLCDVVNSLARHGFDRFFFVNGHGGNVATASAAFSEIYAQASLDGGRAGLRCHMENWWQNDAVMKISRNLFAESEGSHATPSEVSLTYHLFPEDASRISAAELSPEIAPKGPIYDAADYRRRFADGRIGSNPGLATTDAGEQLLAAAAESISTRYLEFLAAE